MKYLQNLHTHTTFCDGKNTCRELIERAIELGFNSIGFSGHGYTPFDIKYSMSKEYIMLERFMDNDKYFCCWQPNASANGRTLEMLLDWDNHLKSKK